MMHGYTIFGCTETGLVRARNEDHILVGRHLKNRGTLTLKLDPDDDFISDYGLLLAVADGIGGAVGGATASRLALITLERQFYGTVKRRNSEDFRQALTKAVDRANQAVLQATTQNSALVGMGCTLTGVCLTGNGYWLFSTGDSRVYRCRNRMLKLLTTDDTVAERNLRLGFAADGKPHSEANHTLVNWVGRKDFTCRFEPGPELHNDDRLLICSDGLYDLVDDTILGERISAPDVSLETLGHQLLQEALAQGGWDNISLILLKTRDRGA